jgi:chromosome segregation ATPase
MTSRSGFTLVAATAVVSGGLAWMLSPGLPVAQAQGSNDVVARAFEAKLDKLEGKADKLESKFDRWAQVWDKSSGDMNDKLDSLGRQANASFPIYQKLETKLDKLESKLDKVQTWGGIYERLEAKLDRLEKKLDASNGGATGNQGLYQKMEAKLDKLESKLDKLQGGAAGATNNGPAQDVYKKLEAKLDKLEGKADRLEGKLDKLAKTNGTVRN